MTLGATRGSNRIQSKGHFGVIKVFLYCNSSSRANRVAFVLCCCGDAKTKSRDRERQRMIQWSRAHAHRREHREKRRVRESVWISAWIGYFDLNQPFRWFRQFQLIQPESAQISANRAESQPRRRELAKKKKRNHVADAARRAVSGIPRTLSRRAASDASAAPLELRPCIPVYSIVVSDYPPP